MTFVTVYSTHSCPFCQKLKEWLDERKIEHEDIFVDDDQVQAEKMLELSDGHMGVPFSVVKFDDGREEKVVGFDKGKLEELLG